MHTPESIIEAVEDLGEKVFLRVPFELVPQWSILRVQLRYLYKVWAYLLEGREDYKQTYALPRTDPDDQLCVLNSLSGYLSVVIRHAEQLDPIAKLSQQAYISHWIPPISEFTRQEYGKLIRVTKAASYRY